MRWGRDSGEEPSMWRWLAPLAPIVLLLVVLGWRGELSPPVLIASALGLALAVAAGRLRSGRDPSNAPIAEAAPGASATEVAPDPVITVDSRSVVADANLAALALFPALKLRQPLAFALRDPRVLDAVPAVTTSGEALDVEIGGRVPGEAAHLVRLRRLGEGQPGPGEPAVALFFRDLTAERRLEAMRVDFIANVSHELRTPLASLSGFVETLRGPARNDPAARERFLGIMATQADRMTRLVNDLLQLSRVELREHQPPSEPIDLAGTVGHMLEIIAPRARERGATITPDLPSEPILVPGDRDELLRVVENLVENAIRYGGTEHPIEVTLRRIPPSPVWPSGAAELAVRDHGPGIAREHLPRLTERFYRVDVADSRASGGTGLGLAIVKHSVGRHRGRLAIESEPGQGALFRIQLPLADDALSSNRHAAVIEPR